jgi:hypothetical protein
MLDQNVDQQYIANQLKKVDKKTYYMANSVEFLRGDLDSPVAVRLNV